MLKKLLQILPAFCLAAMGARAQCPTAAAGPNDTVCISSTATLAATLPAGYTGTWTRIGGSNTTVITTPASATSTVTGLGTAGTRTFVWTITNGTCTVRDTVSLAVLARPEADAGSAITACIGGSVTLNADPLPARTTGRWALTDTTVATVASLTNRQSTATGFTEVGGQPLRWIITSSVCNYIDTDVVVINVNPAVTRAAAGADVAACLGALVALTGNTPTVGTANWSVAQGGNGNVLLPQTVNTPSVQVRATQGGTALVVYRISTLGGNTNAAALRSGCVSTDTVIVRVNPSNANAGADQIQCLVGARVANLAATPAATGETAIWSLVSGAGTITTPGSPTSTVTGITRDTIVLRWTITSGLCRDSDDVRIIFRAIPSVANAGVDITDCEEDTVRLIGSQAIAGNPSWAIRQGNGNLLSFYPNNNNTANNDTVNLQLNNPGSATLYYRISSGGNTPACNSVDSLVITILNAPEANVTGQPTNNICANASTVINLQASSPATGETGRWSVLGGRPGTFSRPTDTVTTVTGLTNGANTLAWTLIGTNGCDSRDTRIFTISSLPTAASAGADRAVCINDTVRLIGSAPVIGTPSWAFVNGNNLGTVVGTGNALNNDSIRIRITGAGTLRLRYRIANGTGNNIPVSCISNDTIVLTSTNCTLGVARGNGNSAIIKVYPNPANGVFNISVDNANLINADVTVLTSDGKTLYNEKWNAASGMEKQIDLSAMPKGLYFMKLQQGQQIELVKLMVQ